MARPILAGPEPPGGRVATAEEVVAFWREAGQRRWFARNADFDALIRERFEATLAAAESGALDHWRATASSALALILVLDQFTRNLRRGSPLAFANDTKARQIVRDSLARGHDQATEASLRLFFYLPLSHAETLDDQYLAVALGEALEVAGGPSAKSAREHRDIIRRFGRFPHRNAILDRSSTETEVAFLRGGGFVG